METNGTRQRWTETRRKKEMNPYDEWLKEEREAQVREQQEQRRLQQQQRQAEENGGGSQYPSLTDPSSMAQQRPSLPTTAGLRESANTIRAVTPDDAGDTDMSQESSPLVPERGTTSFERAFIPFGASQMLGVGLGTTTTIVGGPAAHTPFGSGLANSASSHKQRRLVRENEWEREARLAQTSPDGSRHGSVGTTARTPSGMLARSSSRSNGQSQLHSTGAVPTTTSNRDAQGSGVRPRTRTLEETRRRERSPTALLKSRNRIGSVHSPSSPVYQGAEYLASVPAATSPPSAPSIMSLGSPVQTPVDSAGGRSISPISSSTVDSLTSGLPAPNARRIVHLMKTLNGRMSGNVSFRRGETSRWSQIYCYVKEETGSLMYESRSSEGTHRSLVSRLQGCNVRHHVEDDTPYLEVVSPHSDLELHIKLQTQNDFDSWYATFLYWSAREIPASRALANGNGQLPPYASVPVIPARPDPPPRMSSARSQRERAGSSKSDRRKSVVSAHKEAPVIKIGKMTYWDTNVGYSSQAPSAAASASSTRPQAYRMQSHGSRRWRHISGQLRENGELKLHSDADNSLISVVQLSHLSRCAIQRLDSSVLENDFCLAIYPQYTASLNNNPQNFLRPIFLSLESRVLFEVWFVLLRAFTIPQLYGPPEQSNGDAESSIAHDMAQASSTRDMFRVERSLSIRMVEAKMFPPASAPNSANPDFSHSRSHAVKADHHGYYAEVLLDNETRGKTAVKFEGLAPLWGETFDFNDLPPVLTSASVVIKRRPPDSAHAREMHESRLVHEAYGFTSDQHGGFTNLNFDVTCGKVDISLQDLEEEKEVEKWWPVVNMYNQRVGEVLIKARAEEGVILMAHDYKPLSDLLHKFGNELTLQIAAIVPSELKRLSDCLLSIYQVSGKAGDWLMALIEEEIDGLTKETPLNRLRYSRRIGSNDSAESHGPAGHPHSDRELIVRDMNKNATVEANLLFRGNTLLTKSLDTHMRRVGKEYLEESLAAKIREINEKDPDCEVDPNRVHNPQDLERNWRRLTQFTQDVWKSILAAKSKCPVELRIVFRHIRACAEDRYGDFLRTVSYSSVSGFMFLRFFCPAVLNPKLFGLLKDDIKPRARRTFTLIAKSLQTLANMASFGNKEPWMEPMNTFLGHHRESFKGFIDDICYVPTPLSTSVYASPSASSPTYPTIVPTAETHLSYGTPMTIMQRLPPTSREGFPSLPYLIDQARAYADLVQLWLEYTSPGPGSDASTARNRRYSDILSAINSAEGDLKAFHAICSSLNSRTQECLSRAERAERPASPLSFKWEELIDQLQHNASANAESSDEMPTQASFDTIGETIASDASILPQGMASRSMIDARRTRHWDTIADEGEEKEGDSEAHARRLYEQIPPHSTIAPVVDGTTSHPSRKSTRDRERDRPGSASLGSSIQGSLRRALQSRGSDHSHSQSASASASNVSSAVSSDTEHAAAGGGTTALPNYEREIRHRERREVARQQIQVQMEEARVREVEKESRRRVKTPLAALKRKKDRDREREGRMSGSGSAGSGGGGAGRKGSVQRGVDMSHV
ncbi:GTPase activating factor [Recurvomyces mirabilis]|uniref:GTPase activating factor n=1 Tax=Recurvomyces mirabilis TaxID=574656 RepID=A0AAE0WVZ7_9PEZI|nr:GTPase activating factor [Recurvomyces mirabilis]KAK5161325.1 GTPase activating factor [Recurvomyces mirabilis]